MPSARWMIHVSRAGTIWNHDRFLRLRILSGQPVGPHASLAIQLPESGVTYNAFVVAGDS